MLKTYTAKYTRISSGYMGQLVEWPEVITEGKSLDDCRELLQDALREMIVANKELAERIGKLEHGHRQTDSIISVLVDEIDGIAREVKNMKALPSSPGRKIGFDL